MTHWHTLAPGWMIWTLQPMVASQILVIPCQHRDEIFSLTVNFKVWIKAMRHTIKKFRRTVHLVSNQIQTNWARYKYGWYNLLSRIRGQPIEDHDSSLSSVESCKLFPVLALRIELRSALSDGRLNELVPCARVGIRYRRAWIECLGHLGYIEWRLRMMISTSPGALWPQFILGLTPIRTKRNAILSQQQFLPCYYMM